MPDALPPDSSPGGGRAGDGGARLFIVESLSTGPPERVFALLADGAGWSQWAGPLVPRSAWERQGDPAPGGVGAIRRLGLGRLASREQVVEYVPPRRLSYVLLADWPVRGYRASVELHPHDGGTRIVWSGGFVASPAGTRRLSRLVLRQIVRGLARRLAAAGGAPLDVSGG